ncbi:CgeB family protein [Aquirufa lenticrescens]|uniref:CgeB family protein n=1 Tax=Aquirufa lenticrescens TaxID=2696560 RepID=UPI001CAA7EF4|nr:glycosyltransferase [Aquirufa lenticrescens]UAJ14216.1 glycosyltransferase [Aquirufa lenticrescens]
MEFNLLYIGPLNKNGTCYQRSIAFEKIFSNVEKIDTYLYKSSFFYYFNVLLNKFNVWLDFVGVNNSILSVNKKYDLIWIDKGLIIKDSSLKYLKERFASKLIHYSPDDMLNPGNQSFYYLEALSTYDVHITTKSYNVDELKNLGAKKVIFINNSFDDLYHVRVPNICQKFDIGFIGSFEKERAAILLNLAKKGFSMVIRGNWPIRWVKILKDYNVDILSNELYFPDYSLFIASCKINLCFLRKANRDLQTTRSIEIPAMGGFMLAEDTSEHRSLFVSDDQAVFFSNEEELEEKISFYLRNDDLRKTIAENGYMRTIDSGYSNYRSFSILFDKILK